MGTKMFKLGSFEAELAESMEKTLVTSQLENKYSFDKVAKAADYINAAAELLDDTGFASEAKVLTKVIERLADDKHNELTDEEISNLLLGKPRPAYESFPEEIVIDPIDGDQYVVEPERSSYNRNPDMEGLKELDMNPMTGKIEEKIRPALFNKMEVGTQPLNVNYHNNSIFEDPNPVPSSNDEFKYESVASVAERIMSKYAKKKV